MEAKAAFDAQLKPPVALAPDAMARMLAESQRLDAEAHSLYQRCMLEMRKDSGFPDSTAEYRVISFG